MVDKAKQRTEEHLIDADGERLLRASLPRHWVLREYRPDYGLDFALEVFKVPTEESRDHNRYETLGEHLFVQLKSSTSVRRGSLKLYGRHNVEKSREVLDPDDLVGETETIRFSLETTELVTIQRMGAAIPVLLVVADVTANRCFFVCLNDYVEKVLIPRHDDYTSSKSHTIHVPLANDVANPDVGLTALRWYAKRPKLYAAFQKFIYQRVELEYAFNTPEFLQLANYFAVRIARYDFWDDTEMWGLIPHYGAAVRRFIATGSPGLMRYDHDALQKAAGGDDAQLRSLKEQLERQEVAELWQLLSVLPRNYEEVCREWFLPTALGYLSSYPWRESKTA